MTFKMMFELSVFDLYLKRFITFVFISKHKKNIKYPQQIQIIIHQ